MNANLAQTITNVADLDELYEIALQMVGQVCWRAKFSYGDELILHFGERIPCTYPLMAGKDEGSWILGTRGTFWTLKYPGGNVTTSEADLEILKQRVKPIEGSTLTFLEINYPTLALVLKFSNGCQFEILPSSGDDEYNMPYWELFTPEHTVLQVGPKSSWNYIPSN
jgi:hypothetical protein